MKNNIGSALLFVLWIISILSVIAFEIAFKSKVNYKLYIDESNKIKNYPAIVTCLKTGLKIVLNQNASELHYLTNAHFIFSYKEPEYRCELSFWDEAGKYNINRVSEKDLLNILEKLDFHGEKKDIIVDSILDWRDKDNFKRLNGAENDYYLSLKTPYKCKNGNFDSISELSLVRGVDMKTYNTLSKVFNTISPTNKININSAPKEVLKTLGIDNTIIKDIIEERNKLIFKNIHDLLERVKGVQLYIDLIKDKIQFQDSGIYKVNVKITLNNQSDQEDFLVKLSNLEAEIF